jgi:hypothetical protein
MQGSDISSVHVSPQCAANERDVIQHKRFFFQDVQVGQIAQHITKVWYGFLAKSPLIVFVIAHNENHMWESITASFKEIMKALLR